MSDERTQCRTLGNGDNHLSVTNVRPCKGGLEGKEAFFHGHLQPFLIAERPVCCSIAEDQFVKKADNKANILSTVRIGSRVIQQVLRLSFVGFFFLLLRLLVSLPPYYVNNHQKNAILQLSTANR